MSRCRTCSQEIYWVKIGDRNTPVDHSFNLLPDNAGSEVGVDAIGRVRKGNIVGDSNEDGYVLTYQIHRCGGQI